MAKKKTTKSKRVTGSTGWMRADAVRFVKRRGKPVEVQIRRNKKKKKSTPTKKNSGRVKARARPPKKKARGSKKKKR